MSETIQLDPSAVAAGRSTLDITTFVAAAGANWGDAAISAYLADQTIGSSPVDYRIPNRTITIPLSLRDVGATTFASIRSSLQAKVALFQREGGWVMRQVGSTPLYADVINATLHLGGSWLQAYRGMDVDAVLTLECIPDWYGDEVTLSDHVETTKPELIFTEATVNGNHPGRVRIVVDNDDATNDQHGLLWGLRSRYYDAAATAALRYEAEALTPLNGAAVATRSFTSGGQIMLMAALPDGSWTSMLSTEIASSSQQLTHRGSYRVWARCASDTGTPKFRFVWGVGSLSVPVTNDAVQLPAWIGVVNQDYYLLDLGAIRLDPAPTGTHEWFGVIQALGSASDSAWIDCVYFQPLDDGAGVLTYVDAPPVSSIFQGPKTAGSAVDVTGSGTVSTPTWDTPSAVTASDGVYAKAGFASVSNAGGDFDELTTSSFGFAIPSTATIKGIVALVRRYGVLTGGAYQLDEAFVQLMKAGTGVGSAYGGGSVNLPSSPASAQFGSATDLWGTTWTPSDVNSSGFGVRYRIGVGVANGSATVYVDSIDIAVYYTLASGFLVNQDAVIYATRSAELRTEGMFRDAGGSVYGPVSQVVGDLPRVPPSGLEGRTVEVFLKASRGNLNGETDSGIDDISAQMLYRPSYLYTGA